MKIRTQVQNIEVVVTTDEGKELLSYAYSDFHFNMDLGEILSSLEKFTGSDIGREVEATLEQLFKKSA